VKASPAIHALEHAAARRALGSDLSSGEMRIPQARIRGMGGSMAMTVQGDGPAVAMRCMWQRYLDAVRFWPLLILPFLSVGMLARSSFAQHPQPGWIADAQRGCRIWNPLPELYDSVTWSGACQNGLAQGRGVEQWFKNGQPSSRYEGEFLNGKKNGHGVYTLANGDRYDGDFVEDKRTGHGVYTSAKGDQYDGDFVDGKENGHGVVTFGSRSQLAGTRYDGGFVNGKLTGRGVIFFANGDRCDGGFIDGKLTGHSVCTSAKGSLFEGNWVDGTLITARPRPSLNRGRDIPLENDSGTFKVPVVINGALTLNFTIDSGASDVSIPADVVLTLMRTGTLLASDFLGTQNYRLADGSTVPSKTFRIRTLKVGDRVLENVTGSMSGVGGVPLLGQSFLRRFKSWSIDNQRQVLVLE
jgi:hypothetical protein